jgi:hypothetical protein
MLAFERESARAVWGNCFEMRIMLIEPHPTSDHVEKRTFECARYSRTRVYTVDLT